MPPLGRERQEILPRRIAIVVAALGSLAATTAFAAAGPVELSGRLEALGIVRFDDGTPRQKPLGRIELAATQRWTRNLRWKLSAVGRVGGPPDHPQAGVFEYDRTFQNYSPSLELGEAWLDYRTQHANFRLGTQKFYWGVLDILQPNDRLNPREYEDPFLTEEKDRKIAVPALSIDVFAPALPPSWRTDDVRLTLVWQPIAVPWRYPLPGERWFAPAARAPPSVRADQVPGQPDLPIEQVARNVPAPARRFDNGNVGLRLSGRSGPVDWDLMFFDGYDPAPAFDATVEVIQIDASPGIATQLQPAYMRAPTIGADVSTALENWSLRAEAAFGFRRPWSFELSRLAEQVLDDPDEVAALAAGEDGRFPTYVQRDTVEWGAGADTFFGDTFALFEIYQVILLDNDERLLVRNVDTRLAARVERAWFEDQLDTEFLGLWGIESGYALVRASAAWTWTEGLELELGVLGLWGDRNSLIGQYEGNSQLYGRVRYTF